MIRGMYSENFSCPGFSQWRCQEGRKEMFYLTTSNLWSMIRAQFWIGLIGGIVIMFTFTSYTIVTYRDTIRRHYYDVSQAKMKDQDDDRVGEELRRKVRILCWVMTSPRNLGNKAAAVKDTWGKRCDVLLFFSSVSNSTFPVIGLNVSEGRDHLTAKTMQAFYYIYQHHLNDADWFMKTDDDTYVIIENLRYLLSTQNASRPVYFGHHFKYINDRRTYNSGGAGYVISKEALTRYGVQGRANKSMCRQDGEAEDLSFGECMENLGVVIGNSADSSGRTRFHCFMLNAHLVGDFPDWYYNFSVKAVAKGIDSVSDYAISFHYCRPQDMYMFEFLVYHLHLYGVISGRQDIT